MRNLRVWVVPLWCIGLVAAIGLPWFRGGYLLTYDMVWVPELALGRGDLWGLGSAMPRAVPSDAVVALLGVVFDAQLVQRVLLLGALLAAALAGGRLGPNVLAARLATATLAVWNPYVAERLALGQWPLLIGYAGVLWLAALLTGRERTASALIIALAATAMTPVSGLMGLTTVLVLGRGQRVGSVALAGVALNLPWIVAGLVARGDALSPDPAAVRLFDVQPEGVLGRLGAALSLGGVWNTEVVPVSRTITLLALVTVLVWTLVVAGVLALVRRRDSDVAGLAVLGVLGLAVSLAGWLVPDLLASGIERFGPLALLRDGTRWLALLAPLYVVGFGVGVACLAERLPRPDVAVAAGVLAAFLPIVAVPDLAYGAGGRVIPVDYPGDWEAARKVVSESEVPGDLLALPFTAYRAPDWNDGRSVLDPAGRFFDRTTVVNDELVVSGRSIAGEDPRAARVGAILERSDGAEGLAAEGIGIVVVDTSADGADRALREVDGLQEIGDEERTLRVFEVPDVEPREVDQEARAALVPAWTVAALVLLVAVGATVRRIWGYDLGRTDPGP